MQAKELISIEYWKDHPDFDDYIDLLITHLDSIKSKFFQTQTNDHSTAASKYLDLVFADKAEEYQIKYNIEMLHAKPFFMLHAILKNDLDKAYDIFIDYLDNGFCTSDSEFRDILNFRQDQDCYRTGESLTLRFEEPFKPALMKFNKQREWHVPDPVREIGIEHIVFDCPSGELITADWIRIEELSDRKRAQSWETKYSLNTTEGRINSVIRSNEELNLLDMSLGNMGVNIYQKDNQLIVGHAQEDVQHKDFKEVGSICTDRWSFTCIDRVNLEKILADADVEDTKAVVDTYLAENNYGVNTLKIKPGKYHVYFTADYYEFNRLFKSPDFPLNPEFQYYAIISDKELTLDNNPDVHEGLGI